MLLAKGHEALKRELDAEIGYLKSRNGLEATGQTYYRLDEGVGLDEEDALSRYKGKIQAELGWNFFQSSLYKREGKIKELTLLNQIKRIDFERKHVTNLIYRQKEAFRLKHDSLLAGVLSHRIRNLSLLQEANEYLLRTENISSDELLDILNEKAEAERMMAAIPGVYPQASDLSSPRGVVISIDTAAFISEVRRSQAALSTLDLQRALLEQKERNMDYLQNTTLSPFVRYSYYMRPTVPNSSNIDVGVRFRLPLTGEVRRQKRVYRARKSVLEAERGNLLTRIMEDIRQTLLEIDRMNRATVGELRRLKELKNYLFYRKTAYDNRIGEYSLLARTKEYNIYLSCWEKLLDYQYRRDCLIADLQGYLTGTSITDYCRETEYLSEL